jgi:hypothetical protein
MPEQFVADMPSLYVGWENDHTGDRIAGFIGQGFKMPAPPPGPWQVFSSLGLYALGGGERSTRIERGEPMFAEIIRVCRAYGDHICSQPDELPIVEFTPQGKIQLRGWAKKASNLEQRLRERVTGLTADQEKLARDVLVSALQREEARLLTLGGSDPAVRKALIECRRQLRLA